MCTRLGIFNNSRRKRKLLYGTGIEWCNRYRKIFYTTRNKKKSQQEISIVDEVLNKTTNTVTNTAANSANNTATGTMNTINTTTNN